MSSRAVIVMVIVVAGVMAVGCWTSQTDAVEPRTAVPSTAASSTGRACTGNADCGADSLCVAFVSTIGPRSSIQRECRVNPCGNAPTDCACARQVCVGHGAAFCSLSGGNVSCDDGRQ